MRAPAAIVRTLTLLPEDYAVLRFAPDEPVPAWALAAPVAFASVTRTAAELSVICPVPAVPARLRPAEEWRCLRLEGPFALDEPGVAASVAVPLAAAGLSVFVVATYATDHFLVTAAEAAAAALTAAGHVVVRA